MGNKRGAYYNEIDPYAADWLDNLIMMGHIADGEVDRRSIKDVTPEDLKGFSQCHFFAGIGVWSYAPRLAGVRDDEEVWTGSAPCQPWSIAGQGKGFEDDRHLWPEFYRLVEECRPARALGEQVASKDGLAWLDTVQADLERSDYAVGAVDFCSASVGAPHIRQRLYWVADSNDAGSQGWVRRGPDTQREDQHGHFGRSGAVVGLADTPSTRPERPIGTVDERLGAGSTFGGKVVGLADTDSKLNDGCGDTGAAGRAEHTDCSLVGQLDSRGRPRSTNGFWRDADWLFCTDGKWRPVEPKTFPLAHGITSRMGKLRAYGNAINAHQAKAFIEAVW